MTWFWKPNIRKHVKEKEKKITEWWRRIGGEESILQGWKSGTMIESISHIVMKLAKFPMRWRVYKKENK